MVEFKRQERVLKVKIAYYGPAVGGKTTNLKVLYDRARGSHRGEFVSVNSQQDRTILCDLLPLKSGGFRGIDLRFQLAAVPGQAMYAPARRVVLRGCDGIVFVANSATDRWHENIQTFREMQGNLLAEHMDPGTIPLVFQYNKRDLPDVLAMEALDRGLNTRRVPVFSAVATRGEGVLETFGEIVRVTMEDLAARHPVMQLPEGQSFRAWTEQAIVSMFGASRLEGLEPEEEFVPVDLPEQAYLDASSTQPFMVRVATPEELARPGASPAEARSPEALAESYAQASTELGFAVTDLREERDRARTRLAELRVALELAEKGAEGEAEDRAQRILAILMRSAGAANAGLLLTTMEPPQVLVLPPLVTDPLARTPWGATHLHELRNLAEPRLEEGAEMPELAEALSQAEPVFESVGLVPLRSAERLLALALLYYRPHMTLPTKDVLDHVGFLARVLAGSLEAAAAREASASAERMRALSRTSAAVVASLLTRLPPGAGRRQRIVLEDLLAPLRAPGVTVTIQSNAPPVVGDAPLLRFAVATLIYRCEVSTLEQSIAPIIGVYAGLDDGLVRVHVWAGEGQPVVGVPTAQAVTADADAELSAVYAIMALHEGELGAPEGQGEQAHFVLQLQPALEDPAP